MLENSREPGCPSTQKSSLTNTHTHKVSLFSLSDSRVLRQNPNLVRHHTRNILLVCVQSLNSSWQDFLFHFFPLSGRNIKILNSVWKRALEHPSEKEWDVWPWQDKTLEQKDCLFAWADTVSLIPVSRLWATADLYSGSMLLCKVMQNITGTTTACVKSTLLILLSGKRSTGKISFYLHIILHFHTDYKFRFVPVF